MLQIEAIVERLVNSMCIQDGRAGKGCCFFLLVKKGWRVYLLSGCSASSVQLPMRKCSCCFSRCGLNFIPYFGNLIIGKHSSSVKEVMNQYISKQKRANKRTAHVSQRRLGLKLWKGLRNRKQESLQLQTPFLLENATPHSIQICKYMTLQYQNLSKA